MTREFLLWLDLEMSGLDDTADVITEVAAILTDWNFTELASYHSYIKNDPDYLKGRIDQPPRFWHRYPEQMAALFTNNEAGRPFGEAEAGLLALIQSRATRETTVYLAGNSIWNDRRFVAAYWPRLEARLHHRMLDVSAWKLVFESRYGLKYEKKGVHRAMDDIRESIGELKYYMEKVRG